MERRTERRTERELPVELTAGERSYQGTVRNLTARGAFVEIDARLGEGQRVSVRLRLPRTADPVVADGEVRWGGGRPHGLGLRLAGWRARDLLALGRVL